jgi:hypothetical protein
MAVPIFRAIIGMPELSIPEESAVQPSVRADLGKPAQEAMESRTSGGGGNVREWKLQDRWPFPPPARQGIRRAVQRSLIIGIAGLVLLMASGVVGWVLLNRNAKANSEIEKGATTSPTRHSPGVPSVPQENLTRNRVTNYPDLKPESLIPPQRPLSIDPSTHGPAQVSPSVLPRERSLVPGSRN